MVDEHFKIQHSYDHKTFDYSMYFVKSPWWLKKIYPTLIWDVNTEARDVYLTFDDGPHPVATPFVLDTLKAFKAQATFFCIGKNVKAQPVIYRRITEEGHAVGNHTNNHLNGWKTGAAAYVKDVADATEYISSNLFRPPYGKITRLQISALAPTFGIVMWDVLSADFDTMVTPEKSLAYVTANVRPGSIIVFHDSEKAFARLKHALPGTLQYLCNRGYSFKKIAALPA